MPFKLCQSEKKRLDELIDHVRELSDTVDELRAEVNAMKISSSVASIESLRRKKTEASTLHKLKRCLEKSLTPVFSRDPTYSVRKKCQQMFSQFPTIISRSTNLPGKQHPDHQHFTSPYAKDIRRSNRKDPPAYCLDEATAKREGKIIQSTLQRHKKHSKNSEKDKSLQTFQSSSPKSDNPIIESYESYNSYCTDKTCTSMKSSGKTQDLGKFEKKLPKKKTTDASFSTSPVRPLKKPRKQIIDPETVKHQRSVTFIDRARNIQHEQESSSSSSFSSSNTSSRLEDCDVIYTKPKTDFKIKRTINSSPSGPEEKNKRSSSAQCSRNCEYMNNSFLQKKDNYTSTLPQNSRQEDQSLKMKTFKKARRKKFASQETQTPLISNKHGEEKCFIERRRYCPKAKRTCFPVGSLSSLTSCSPRSISSFCLGSEELGEGLMNQYYKRKPITEETFEKKRSPRILKKETDNVEKVHLLSSQDGTTKSAKKINMNPRSIRKKRTYIISPEQVDQSNFYELQNASFSGDSVLQDRQLQQPKSRKKWKKPETPQKVCQDHQLWNNESYTNHRTERLYPKPQRLPTRSINKQTKPTKLTKFRETTSSSGPCTDETCSLTSNPSLSRLNTSILSNSPDRREKPTKDFNAFVR